MKLPSGYTQLEYIESTGTQYINTGLSLPKGFRIKGKLMATSLPSTGNAIFGAEDTLNDVWVANYFLMRYSSDYWLLQGNSDSCFGGTAQTNVVYEFDACNIVGQQFYVKINGENKSLANGSNNGLRSSLPCYLFADNFNNSPIYPAAYRHIGVWEIYNENSQLVRKYVPCKSKSGVIGLYDLVEGAFYGNNGTGTFIAGGVVKVFKAAGKALVGGTAYEIKGGKTLVNGTAFNIDKGKVLVNGTVYEIGFCEYSNAIFALTFEAVPSMGCTQYEEWISDAPTASELGLCNVLKVNGTSYDVSCERKTDTTFTYEAYIGSTKIYTVNISILDASRPRFAFYHWGATETATYDIELYIT